MRIARASRIGPCGWLVTILTTATVSFAVLAAHGRQEPMSQRPSFRSGTTIVEVDVIVDDRAGRFAADLGPSDFTLFEDGRQQTIETMYVVVGTAIRLVHAPAAATAAARGFIGPRVQQVFVLVFDTGHFNMGAAERARAAAEAFLAKDFRSGDIGGIVSRGKMVNDRLSTDRAELVAAVRAMRPDADALARRRPDGTFDPVDADNDARGREGAREQSETLATGERATHGEEARRRGADTLRTIRSLVRGLARLPGRKNVVLFSDGFALPGVMPGERPGSDWSLAQRIVQEAARATVRIYAIDTRGLEHSWANSALVTATEPTAVEVFEPASPMAPPPRRVPIDNRGLLTMMANDTGGILVSNQNDLGKALSEIAEDSTSHYVLGYRSTNAAKDGRFRKIDVRTSRSDLRVRARKGYIAER